LKSKNKNNRNKKIKEKYLSSNSSNSIDSKGQLTSKSKSKNSMDDTSSRYSKKNESNRKSITNSSELYNDLDENDEEDIPKKTMEFINNNQLIQKKINQISDDEDDMGENYGDEFSEKMAREVKYFNPKQIFLKREDKVL